MLTMSASGLRTGLLALVAAASLSACTTNEYGERVPGRPLRGAAIGAAGGAALGAITGGNIGAAAALGAAAGAIVGVVEDDKNRYEDRDGRRYYYERDGRRYRYDDRRQRRYDPY
jgi:hypothetical protein